MTYSSGQTVLQDEYNILATGNAAGTGDNSVANVNTIWGVGAGDKGYGQSTTLSAVASGGSVTATQWSTLVARVDSITKHQTNAAYTVANGPNPITAGTTITAVTNLSSSLSTLFTNRLTAFAQGTVADFTTGGVNWTSATPTTFTQTRTITFASANEARYFFNAGGDIRMIYNCANAGDNNKEISFDTLVDTNLVTLTMTAHTSTRTGTGGTLTTNGSAIGFYELTTANQTLIKLTSTSSGYTANYVEVLAKVNAGGTVVTIQTNYQDDAADDAFGGLDAINIDLTAQVRVRPPEITYLTNTWGTPTGASTLN